MPRVCTICINSERGKIEKMLLNGEPYRSIAKQYSLSEAAVYRHKSHLNVTLLKARRTREVAHADNLLDQVKDLQSRALKILSKAEKAEEWRAATSAIREARGCLELLGKLAGELKDGQSVNIVISPEWIGLRAAILEALIPYPEARYSVSKAMEKLSNGSLGT